MLYGVLIFVGFETAANLAEETADPKRSIPRAVLGAVVIVSIFYLIAAYVEVAGFGFDLSVITSPEVAGAPLFALGAPGSPAGSEFWLKTLLLVVFLDMLAVYVGAGRRLDTRRVRVGQGSAAAGPARRRCRGSTGPRRARSSCSWWFRRS